MKVQLIGKLVALPVLALTLAGCIDVEMDVALTSDATARVTTTQIISADFYEMVAASAEDGEEGFCAPENLTETDDGGAICVDVKEGPFAELIEGDEEGGMVFAAEGPNLVRVTLPLDDIEQEMGAGEELDAETRAMMQSMFEGRTITVSVSGLEIVETNMERSADGKSASIVLGFMDIIDGETGLDGDLFALVRTP
jgi:hypothetical protein